MKKILQAITYFIALVMTGCATYTPPEAGHTYTDPVISAVGTARSHLAKAMPVIDSSAKTGTQPLDPKLTQAGVDVHAADKVLVAVPAYVTKVNTVIDKAAITIRSQNTVISKQAHRIFVDDCIFGVPIAIIGGLMIFKILKFAAIL
jgi:hypothetical protein